MQYNIAEISNLAVGSTVKLHGFVHELRDLAKLKFILLRDATGIVQCIIKDSNLFDAFKQLTLESVIVVNGTIKEANVKSKDVTINDKEIEVSEISIISIAQQLPIPVVEKTVTTSFSKKLDYRCLDLRKQENASIFNVQSMIVNAAQQWLTQNGFLQVFTPCLIGQASESGAEVFPVIYFDREAFLRQDPQLHRQLTILGGFEKIFEIGPCWRAELSHTTKHLTEHRVIAVEKAFTNSNELMDIQEKLIKHIYNILKQSQYITKVEAFKNHFDALAVKQKFPRISFEEAKEITHGNKQDDLNSEEEKILAKYIKQTYDSDFYFVYGFPFSIKPFYVYHEPGSKKAESIDMYCSDVELSSGGQREHRYDVLIQNIKEKQMDASKLEWFTKFFKYGAMPHGGFAIGVERLTKVMLGLQNIKQAVLFPRDPERLLP